MKSAGKARNNGLYRHIRTSKEIIRNLLNDSKNILNFFLLYTPLLHKTSSNKWWIPHYIRYFIFRYNTFPI